ERRREAGEIRLQDLEAARIVLGESRLVGEEVERGAAPLARLRQDQCSIGEVEGGEPETPGRPGAAALPAKAARDHQVDAQEEPSGELENDSLAETSDPLDPPADHRFDRRLYRTHEEGARDPDALDLAPRDPGSEALHVDLDVWQLRHRAGDEL